MDKNDQNYVVGVLNMYSSIYGAYNNKLKKEERETFDVNRIKFIGFDGNEGRGLLYFCDYLIDDLKRFTGVGEFIKEHGWERNSHGFGDTELEQMYHRYESIKNFSNFGLKEIEHILGK